MRKAIMIAGLVLALGVLAPATALGNAAGTDRPISGHWTGTNLLDLGTLSFTTDATGVSSHLGKGTVHLDGVATFTGQFNTINIAGSILIVAANGDEVFGTFSGSGTLTSSLGSSQGTSVTTFTGGTGRFANASGSASGPFTQTLNGTQGTALTFAIEFSLSGTISY